jgi:hypothetical protein
MVVLETVERLLSELREEAVELEGRGSVFWVQVEVAVVRWLVVITEQLGLLERTTVREEGAVALLLKLRGEVEAVV